MSRGDAAAATCNTGCLRLHYYSKHERVLDGAQVRRARAALAQQRLEPRDAREQRRDDLVVHVRGRAAPERRYLAGRRLGRREPRRRAGRRPAPSEGADRPERGSAEVAAAPPRGPSDQTPDDPRRTPPLGAGRGAATGGGGSAAAACYSVEVSSAEAGRGGAAATTWIFRGDGGRDDAAATRRGLSEVRAMSTRAADT